MIFFNNDGPPIRFFVQKDGLAEERSEVEAIILEEGGVLSDKVVKKGYVVLFMDTPEANRIIERWTDQELPHRYFVSTDWVKACKAQNRLLCQVFVDNGVRVKMHIHSTIANFTSREELTRKIKLHGGDPDASVDDATIIIASRETPVFKEMRVRLQGREDKFVEHLTWVDNCIEQSFYHHSPNPIRSFGGRRTGDERTPFTEEDEINLCKYIASVLPYKETGGRTGNRIYTELIEAAQTTSELKWALRHTWQSWRERYKKNKDRLDLHISAIVNSLLPNGSLYPPFKDKEPQVPSPISTFVISQSSEPQVAPLGSQGEGWRLQETPETTPSWAKRKVSEHDDPGDPDPKRSKTDNPSFRTFVLTPSPAPPLSTSPPAHRTNAEAMADFRSSNAPWNQVEEEINGIARSFQFLADEVRSYYAQTGDLVATRRRFEKARALINALP